MIRLKGMSTAGTRYCVNQFFKNLRVIAIAARSAYSADMRILTFAIAALNISAFIYLVLYGPAIPDAMGTGWTTLIGLVVAVLHIPALILAISNKAVPVALLLVLVLPVLAGAGWVVNTLPG